MENSGGITASLSASLQGRYASALFELASESKAVAVVESDLEKLGQAILGSGDLAALIRNPQIGRDAAAKAVDGVGGVLGLSGLTRKFLGVLAANRRLTALPDIVRAFSAIASAARGEVKADVVSAHPLSDAQLKALAAKLKAREGKDVTVSATVDPAILGGLVVKIGSTQIDSSIRTRLNTLAQAMKG
ncbi:MAG: F0F1 ATP synthase subunit delta [Novosphingobium sp.]|uniref:F0F1 ATP synthase subunit delta n=1 Tax=Novosphingobium sp. TaxID=1874826 RepID=UPI0017CEDC44|nr:F0F1 ATP synthase subunit delta [Novosphingobium sp.]